MSKPVVNYGKYEIELYTFHGSTNIYIFLNKLTRTARQMLSIQLISPWKHGCKKCHILAPQNRAAKSILSILFILY